MKISTHLALKVSAVYAILGLLWIFFSDRALFQGVAPGSPALLWAQIGKGWFYVTATAALLFAMVSHWVRRVDHCETRFSRIVEGAETLIVELDRERLVLYANPFARVFFGDGVKDLAPSPIPKVALSRGDGAQVAEHRRVDGRPAWVAWTCRPMPQEDGSKGEGFLCVGVDVTARHLAEAELAEEREKRRQAQKMEAIGTLTSGIAHDFNNVLGIVMSHTELALLQTPHTGPARACLEQALQGAVKGRELVRQLLAFCRPEALQGKLGPVAFREVVQEMLALLRPTLPRGIDLREELDSARRIAADPTQIHQVVQNLCVNAVQAMEGKGRLLVRLEDRGDRVALLVSDSGPGMDKAVQARIFEPYFTTKAMGQGTGLGLAVVHGIARRHGASIAIRSAPGEGTTFEVLFPVAKEQPLEIVVGA